MAWRGYTSSSSPAGGLPIGQVGFYPVGSTGPDQGDWVPPYSLFVFITFRFSSEVGPGEALS